MIKLLRMMAVALCLVVLCPPFGGALAQTETPPPTPTNTGTPPPGGSCPVNTPMATPLDPSWAAGCSVCMPTPTPAGTRLPTFVMPTANFTPQGSLTPTITGTIYPTNTPTITPTPGMQPFEWKIITPAYHLSNPLGNYAVPETAYFGYWPECPSGADIIGINIDMNLWAGTYGDYPTVSYLNQADNKDLTYNYYSAIHVKHSLQAYRYEGYYPAPDGYLATRYSAYNTTNFNGDNFVIRIYNNKPHDMHATINRLSTYCYGVPPPNTPTPTTTPQYGVCNEYKYLEDDPIASVDGSVVISAGECYSLLASQTIDIPGTDTDIAIPGLRLCPAWVTLPTFGIFGINIPTSIFALPFALYLVGLIMRI